jgi:hypothetical protein
MSHEEGSSTFANFEDPIDWLNLGLTIFCITCGGLAAGLTIGLVSIDKNELRLMKINGTTEQKRQARRYFTYQLNYIELIHD